MVWSSSFAVTRSSSSSCVGARPLVCREYLRFKSKRDLIIIKHNPFHHPQGPLINIVVNIFAINITAPVWLVTNTNQSRCGLESFFLCFLLICSATYICSLRLYCKMHIFKTDTLYSLFFKEWAINVLRICILQYNRKLQM